MPYNPGGYESGMDYGPYGNYGRTRFSADPGGGGGMPPVAIAAGIAGIGSVASGVLANRGQSRAIEAQTASTDKALAYQREQDAKGEAAYAERWKQWEAGRRMLMERYGIDITPPGDPGGAPQGPPGAQPRGMMPQMAEAKGISPMQGQGLGQLWNSWKAQGLPGQDGGVA